MAGPPKSCRAVWAHFTATRSHTTAGFSVTTASISQWLRQALHPESWAPGIRDYWMRIVPTSITGRAITRHHGEAEGT